VLGYSKRLESVATTRSSTFLTLNNAGLDELSNVNSKLKSEITVIALERARRALTRSNVFDMLQEMQFLEILTDESRKAAETVSNQRAIETKKRGGIPPKDKDTKERCVYVPDWKTLVEERVRESRSASLLGLMSVLSETKQLLKDSEKRRAAQQAENEKRIEALEAKLAEVGSGSGGGDGGSAVEAKLDSILAALEKRNASNA